VEDIPELHLQLVDLLVEAVVIPVEAEEEAAISWFFNFFLLYYKKGYINVLYSRGRI
jgi:hypothetical protein